MMSSKSEQLTTGLLSSTTKLASAYEPNSLPWVPIGENKNSFITEYPISVQLYADKKKDKFFEVCDTLRNRWYAITVDENETTKCLTSLDLPGFTEP